MHAMPDSVRAFLEKKMAINFGSGIFVIFVFSAVFLGCYSVPKIGMSVIYQSFTDDEKKRGKQGVSLCAGTL